ncbi:MAG: sugar ABC transporter permease [Treponemataceae bacterium]|nr:sugar ABC transporter permease [Treponemataceae bacterium]
MINNRKQTSLLVILLLAPALIIFSFFVVVPIFKAAYYSFFKWNGLTAMKFIGFKNFVDLANDPVFLQAIGHTLLVTFISLLIELPLALLCALIISNKNFKGAVAFRTFFFLPYAFSEIISGIIWQFIYNPQYGFVKAIYSFFAPGAPVPAPLANTSTVLWAILVTVIWKYFGFHMSIMIAGLQDIPDDVREAAKIDGATESQTTRKIIIPLLLPTLLVSIFFSIVGSFQLYDIVWAMGKGGPANAAETLVTYLYNYGLKINKIGYGSAVAVVIFLMCLVFSAFYGRAMLKSEDR